VIGLYLMTEKGLAVLDAALAARYRGEIEIAHVTTFAAVGMNDTADVEIAKLAKESGIPTFSRAHPPEYTGQWSIAAGWRWRMDVPNLIVLHDSLLPRYRGFAPLITALAKGDPELGVTAFLATDEVDAGPIIAQRRFVASYPTTMHETLGRIVPLYRELAAEVIAQIPNVRYTAQDHSKATYSVWRDEDDYRIDWTQDDRAIVRLIGACSHPFPGAWTTTSVGSDKGWGDRVRITDATVEQDVRFEQRDPGKVAFIRDGCPIVVCGTGMVRILASSEPIPFRTRLV
jgi:methionyl-tRNA formyltransferase